MEPRLKADHPASFWWMLILTYASGSCIAGMIVGGSRRKWGGLQATVITLQAISLWLAYILSPHSFDAAASFICVASGLQNGSTGNLDVIVLRTANVTGSVVDIGLAFGQCLREGFAKHRWKLGLWVPCVLFFWIGAMCGAVSWVQQGDNALVPPASVVTGIALASWAFAYVSRQKKLRRQASMDFSPHSPTTSSYHHFKSAQGGGFYIS